MPSGYYVAPGMSNLLIILFWGGPTIRFQTEPCSDRVPHRGYTVFCRPRCLLPWLLVMGLCTAGRVFVKVLRGNVRLMLLPAALWGGVLTYLALAHPLLQFLKSPIRNSLLNNTLLRILRIFREVEITNLSSCDMYKNQRCVLAGVPAGAPPLVGD